MVQLQLIHFKEALQFLLDAEANQLRTTRTSYNVAISACEKGGAWESALFLAEKMQILQLTPDVCTYSALITACATRRMFASNLRRFSESTATELEGSTTRRCTAACSGTLPDGFVGYESRRLQVFNVPWLPQAPVNNVVHQAQQAQAAGGNVMDQVQKQIHHVIKDTGVASAPRPSVEEAKRAEELQNQEVVVYKSSPSNSICPQLPRPIADWAPTNPLPQKEKEAIAIRFERQSRVRLRLKTGKEGCGPRLRSTEAESCWNW
eukprot:s933_g3.t1